MADISKWRTFNKETNMVGISILQIFQSDERYLNRIQVKTPKGQNTEYPNTENQNTENQNTEGPKHRLTKTPKLYIQKHNTLRLYSRAIISQIINAKNWVNSPNRVQIQPFSPPRGLQNVPDVCWMVIKISIKLCSFVPCPSVILSESGNYPLRGIDLWLVLMDWLLAVPRFSEIWEICHHAQRNILFLANRLS